MNIFKVVMEVIAIITALVNIVERPGDGEAKRKEVVDLFMTEAKQHLSLPKWAADLFLRRTFIGWLVDIIVWSANTYGPFGESTTPPGEPSSDSSLASA